MKILPALFLLPLLSGVSATLLAQDAPALTDQEKQLREQMRTLEEKLQVVRAAGLQSVKINGVELNPQQVRREAIFLVGAKLVEAKMSEFFIEEWMENAIRDGRDPADFEISEDEIVGQLKDQVTEFQDKNPGVEFWEAVRSLSGMSREAYTRHARQNELFKRVFFPGSAAEWPSITREAIMASAGANGGEQFWQNIENSATDPETGEPRELPGFWLQLCQGWVQKQLKKWSDIRYPSDGLPADVVLSVNGRTWSTDEAFEYVRPALFLTDIERAMTEMVVREALAQELARTGHGMSDEEFRTAFEEYRQEFDDTPFTTEVIATAFKGYPSLEAFRQRWRLMRSFETMIEGEITDENLAKHLDKYSRFFSDGKTSVDFIQFMARDLKTGAWQPDGFERAKERAQAAFEEIAAGKPFLEVLQERGEFYVTDEAKGRHGSKSLNQLRQAFGENEFTDLLYGYSLGSYLFYDVEPGTITSPMRGPNGYFVARVNARTPPRGMVTIDNPRTRELVKQDYVTSRFMAWANETLASTSVE